MKIEIENKFHGTITYAYSGDIDPSEFFVSLNYRAYMGDVASKRRLTRIDNELCGIKDCMCGGMWRINKK